MALKIIDYLSPAYQSMVALRNKILRIPLGLEITAEDQEAEKDDVFLGYFDDEQMEACCVLTKIDSKTVKLRQMAVADNTQGMGTGRILLTFAENVARDFGYKKLTMHARKSAVGFYQKNGYHICSDEFEEVTIPHYVMQKEIG